MLSSFKTQMLISMQVFWEKSWISNWNKVWSVSRFTIINRSLSVSLIKYIPWKNFSLRKNKRVGLNDISCSEASLSYDLFEEVQRATFCYKGRKCLSSSEKQLVLIGIRKSPLPKVFFKHHSQPRPASELVAFIVFAQGALSGDTTERKLICTMGAGLNQTKYIQYYHLLTELQNSPMHYPN